MKLPPMMSYSSQKQGITRVYALFLGRMVDSIFRWLPSVQALELYQMSTRPALKQTREVWVLEGSWSSPWSWVYSHSFYSSRKWDNEGKRQGR